MLGVGQQQKDEYIVILYPPDFWPESPVIRRCLAAGDGGIGATLLVCLLSLSLS